MALEDALRDLEDRILATNAGWLDRIDELRRLLAMEASDAELTALLAGLPDLQIDDALREAIRQAFALGATDAVEAIPTAVAGRELARAERVAAVGAPAAIMRQSITLDSGAAAARGQALTLIAGGADVQVALAPLFAMQNSVNATVTSSIVDSGNAAVEAVGKSTGRPLVWVAERDACVRCLAYQGRVVKAGADFPAGLTFGKAYPSIQDTTVTRPPLHPRCRCVCSVLYSQEYADALRREAERSILRGISLPSESEAARLEAARRLIEDGVDAPKSVIDFARGAIKKGKFPTRANPTG